MEGQKCLGMLVEVDLVRCMAQGGALTAGWSHVVREIGRPVEAMPTTARRSDAARRMAYGAEAVLVTCGDRLLGIVTTSDLVRVARGHARGAPTPTRNGSGSVVGASTALATPVTAPTLPGARWGLPGGHGGRADHHQRT